ncbi:uncharacterized protein FSUBG_5329 [Fusarium subglutinans]|uniref:Uncharacterized protein n=1 Tax=Gibberella subglutinans TaxID=42677 RepID=A0A8H5V3H1_GIBSU|nr:uncharacterized protein FSUBG_5329 [Fusarium subglutinans]KAF5607430.1 hypothetical protein FSUBG_5329 [Fusarium subglutinans]
MSMRLIFRPVVRIPLLRPQIRLATTNPTHVHPDGNLGGPGGQQPPPVRPGGPEAITRNWMPIAAAAAVIAGGVFIILPTRGKSPERTLESDMVAANSTAIGYIGQPSGKPGIASHYRELRDGKEVESMKELSGRKGGGSMGPFRAE